MYNEINHLQKKFFALSAAISFAVIFVMLFVLNILMNVSFNNELKAAADIVSQTAISNAPDMDSETILLSDTQTDENGNYIIERNPKSIQNITINGEIQYRDNALIENFTFKERDFNDVYPSGIPYSQ